MLAKSLESGEGIKSVAVFNTPVGANAPGPITPGAAYEVTIFAVPGDRLSLTTMMGQSNDWFYAPAESGIELFKNVKPISGDITSQIILWDAGTEVTRSLASGRIRDHDKKRPTPEKPRTASCATPRMSNTAALI